MTARFGVHCVQIHTRYVHPTLHYTPLNSTHLEHSAAPPAHLDGVAHSQPPDRVPLGRRQLRAERDLSGLEHLEGRGDDDLCGRGAGHRVTAGTPCLVSRLRHAVGSTGLAGSREWSEQCKKARTDRSTRPHVARLPHQGAHLARAQLAAAGAAQHGAVLRVVHRRHREPGQHVEAWG